MMTLLFFLLSCDNKDSVEDACADEATLVTASGEVSCEASGQLCDAGACVDPWAWGSPEFTDCAGDPDATPEGLAQKAATYEERAHSLHIHPELQWMMGVELPGTADPATATWEDVAQWQSNENDGLWSSHYLSAEAFRYAATEGDERLEALETVRAMLAAEEERMAVSGVRGNFVRKYVKPGIEGLSCPEDDEEYRADEEKDDNRWVKLDGEGCLTWLPVEGEEWVDSGVCPGPDYANWCFLDNTSKDEYSGHMFALGAVLKLVDDEESQAIARRLVTDVVDELLENDLWMSDADGRHTEHGDFSPAYGAGFNAAMFLSFLTIAESSTGEARFTQALGCLTGRDESGECPVYDPEFDEPFQDYIWINGVHLDYEGCYSNDNVASMHALSLASLLWWETDPELRAIYQEDLTGVWSDDFLRNLENRENAWYDMIWAAFKAHGSESDGPAYAAVTDAACGLARFPTDEVRREVPASDNEEICLDRLDRPMGAEPRGPHERCLEQFIWWKDQYVLAGCEAEPGVVEPPADYLLPYWMGRYFGFIDPSW